MREMIVHLRRIGRPNDTLCGFPGAKIFLSNRITCKACKDLLDSSSFPNSSKIIKIRKNHNE